MLKFRNGQSNYKDLQSKPIESEEYEHTEKEINGQVHLVGDKKTINLCSDTWAKNHFPNPKDYTLENLIKSGANLRETTAEIGNTESELEETTNLINKLNKEENGTN